MSLSAYLRKIREDRHTLTPRRGTISQGGAPRGRSEQWLFEYVGTGRRQGAIAQDSLCPRHCL